MTDTPTTEALTMAYSNLGPLKDVDLVELEERLRRDPEDCLARAAIQGLLWRADLRGVQKEERRAQHVAWWIDRYPEHSFHMVGTGHFSVSTPSACETTRRLWEAALARHPDRPRVFMNAALSMSVRDRERALEWMDEALRLASAVPPPSSPEERDARKLMYWQAALLVWQTVVLVDGEVREVSMAPSDATLVPDLGPAASDYLDRMRTISTHLVPLNPDPDMQGFLLVKLAALELAAGEDAPAREHAREALDIFDAFTGKAIFDPLHEGHLVLGWIALREGDVRLAGEELLKAVSNPSGSHSRASFTPDMRLARELLARGERRVVLEYLELAEVLWRRNRGWPAKWRDAIERGEEPDWDEAKRFP